LAEVRHESWKKYAWPAGFARLLDRSGVAIAVALITSFTALFALAQGMRPASGEGFYASVSHTLMVTIFAPAFLFPLLAISISLRAYWRDVDGNALRFQDLRSAFCDAGRLKNLAGGHGDGCNFEDKDRFSQARRHFHQATLYGFLLCFGATASGTVLHYAFALEAPYGFFSLPKLLGVPGGILLCLGTAGLAWLKTKADPELDAPKVWSGEMAFVLLLFAVSFTGLVLYAASGTAAVPILLALHLGTVLTFFLLMPYSKMAHGFYRLAALARDANRR
jgi:citrate/tricarballylate utilization protein